MAQPVGSAGQQSKRRNGGRSEPLPKVRTAFLFVSYWTIGRSIAETVLGQAIRKILLRLILGCRRRWVSILVSVETGSWTHDKTQLRLLSRFLLALLRWLEHDLTALLPWLAPSRLLRRLGGELERGSQHPGCEKAKVSFVSGPLPWRASLIRCKCSPV
jgi:hypothetical protein